MSDKAEMEESIGRGDARGRKVIPPLLLVSLGVGVFVIALLAIRSSIEFANAALWGLALYVSGALIGFLFGIPKIPDRESDVPAAGSGQGATAGTGEPQDLVKASGSGRKRLSGINSNLVEVSDWLTKIIVGVGLVELKNLPDYGKSLAGFMASSLVTGSSGTPAGSITSIAGAIALSFGVLGFITGYLMTRIFLAVIMNDADRDAEQASIWRLSTGTEVSTTTMFGNLMSAVADLQERVARLIGAPAAKPEVPPPPPPQPPPVPAPVIPAATSTPSSPMPPGAAQVAPANGEDLTQPASSSPPQAAASSDGTVPTSSTPAEGGTDGARRPLPANAVLWVDNKPQHHALIVDKLRRASIQVLQVTTTEQALEAMKQTAFDAIITDMHRGERSPDHRPSGLRFLELAKRVFESAPASRKPVLMLYCAKSSLARYQNEAREAGADVTTSSEVELISRLSELFPSMG